MKEGSTPGVVYTPDHWADWAVREYRIHRRWMDGGSILDPGCGTGSLIAAVIRAAMEEGFRPADDDLRRLRGIDIDGEALKVLEKNMKRQFGLRLPSGVLREADFLTDGPFEPADTVLANPPWVSFGDLTPGSKELYKPLFRSTGLVGDARNLLLGGSRIDLAALFTARILEQGLKDRGEAFLFLPLSLYRSEGAHDAFRNLALTDGTEFALEEVRELGGAAPFPGAGTSCGFIRYRMGIAQVWPVPWLKPGSDGTWRRMDARPVDDAGSPLRPLPRGTVPPPVPRIRVPGNCRPRQGANTCGAAEAFIVRTTGPEKNGSVPVVNRRGREGRLPAALLHPLMGSAEFVSGREQAAGVQPPERRILLPYRPDGKIMNWKELSAMPGAPEWLEAHRELLENRKGSLIRGQAGRGLWWAMLGVGPYCFSPWKVAWEAYGRSEFSPRLFGPDSLGSWQGNQALHAYLPFDDEKEARRVLAELKAPAVEEYLSSLGGAGTKLWAQPGRILRILDSGNQKR